MHRVRNQHFPLFTHGRHRGQSECHASGQVGSHIGGVPATSSSAFGFTDIGGVHDTGVVYALHNCRKTWLKFAH